ncbi:p21-C-terminal region-binding protein-domain-containing protein [Pisolithus orientalis]|uniref:p21-C-terminal region-binding protein-domain-containing protein n=1 Tax=Pisolithus orientalis TaxID=936130 RepID=UPI0022257F43|nr:p21-C-terminal region-binding protein-domain-containing protein [Pisolithus orientalis]KAI6002634.1 p21-C-terminal region-binding protein-domain-containing protein [Pisolithus orientalis]
MSKRKQNPDADADYDSSDEETPAFVDVDFDFFSLNAEVDYHAINRLLIQLFGADAEGLQTGRLADLILSAADSGVGSTIKTDGEESDPCALLTVLSCDAHRDNPAVKVLIEYMLSKISADLTFHSTLSSLLAPKTQVQNQAQAHLGLVLSERLINMPVQVVPPMYRMLVDELQDAVADGDPYNFTHYLFISRVYRLTPEEEEAMAAAQRNSKRYKSAGGSELGRSRDGVYGFHPEDEEIMKFSEHVLTYSYTNAPARDAESIGLDVGGRAMLVPADRFEALVRTIGEVFSAPGST